MKVQMGVCLALVAVAQIVSGSDLTTSSKPYHRKCEGTAKYKLTFSNFLTGDGIYKGIIPKDGLIFSPVAGAGHSGKISILVLRGYASPMVIDIAEKGDNTALVTALKSLSGGELVKSYAAADGPTMPGKETELMFEVDCDRPYISALGMLAGSPDWIVAVSNFNTVVGGHFIHRKYGYLFTYDAGTDKGPAAPTSIFTPPDDLSLDVPQDPPLNIHPLSESPEDPGFNGRAVGKYVIERVY